MEQENQPDKKVIDGSSQSAAGMDVFADNESYRSIEHVRQGALVPQSAGPDKSNRQESLLPKVLISSFLMTILVVFAFGLLLKMSSLKLVNAAQQTNVHEIPVSGLPAEIEQETDSITISDEQPVSLKTAQAYFNNRQYKQAFVAYEKLQEKLAQTADSQFYRDFLQLNKALCLQCDENQEEAISLLKAVSLSGSPILKVLANYHLSFLEMNKKQFLQARSRAYQSIALLELLNFDKDWISKHERNLNILAAEAASRLVISLADLDKGLSQKIWFQPDLSGPPLQELDEQQLKKALNEGCDVLNAASLAPSLEKNEVEGRLYWSVNCSSASISELMSRFASVSGCDIRWQHSGDGLRNRPVNLYVAEADELEFVTLAAGCAGLAVSVDNKMITLSNPDEFSSVTEQLSVLAAEATGCWQEFLLDYLNDSYLPNAHFMLGLLRAQQGLTADALAEFKMAAGRSLNSMVGPYALSCSAKLKGSLYDHQGAYEDLNDAVEQFPDHEGVDQTYIALATAAKKIGNDEQAAKIFTKVYYLSDSTELRSTAAFEAGKIFFEKHNLDEAEKWLTEYIDLAKDRENVYQACLYLGKIWLEVNKFDSASAALRAALAGRLSQQDYMETITALTEGYIRQERFVDALELLKNTPSRQLSQEQTVAIIILESGVLRGMGLADKAEKMLNDKDQYILDDILKAQIGYELSECYIEQGKTDLAYKKLADILDKAGSGAIAHKTAFRLARLCVELGFDDQSLNTANKLLNMNPPAEIRQETLKLIAELHNKKHDYDRAAMVMLGQWQ